MLLEALLALTTVMPRIDAGMQEARMRVAALRLTTPWPSAEAGPPVPPIFQFGTRAVSNWREEAGASLLPASLAFVAEHAVDDPAFVARCVKLNNYWCIKQAGWAGELGGDAEHHTAFATAADGADAAAQLLRRYYRNYGRRTALAIVRRWAPAECGPSRIVSAPPRVGFKPSTGLAPRGIGTTVRARFLARHGRGGIAGPGGGAMALRVQPWSTRARLAGHPGRVARTAARPRPMPALAPVSDIISDLHPPAKPQVVRRPVGVPVPGITVRSASHRSTVGAADPSALLRTDRLAAEAAALPSIAAGLPAGSLLDLSVPAPFCGSDEARIRAYAARIAASLGLGPADDLRLFEADGSPTAGLAPVMLAMSSVELGSLRAAPILVIAAIARLTDRPAAATD